MRAHAKKHRSDYPLGGEKGNTVMAVRALFCFTAVAAVAASLMAFALPAVSPAQAAAAAPSAARPAPSLQDLTIQGERQCVQPPRAFNLKTLSDAQLALYGLPARRILETPFGAHLLAHYKHRSCGPDTPATFPRPELPNLPRTHSSKTATVGPKAIIGCGTIGSANIWAGNWACTSNGARGVYQTAEVDFTVPYISGPIGADAAFWTGVGGRNTYPASLVQTGVIVMQCPDGYTGPECVTALQNGSLPDSYSGPTWRYNYAFYEIVNNDSSCADLWNCSPQTFPLAIYPNDQMSAVVMSNFEDNPYDYMEVCDYTQETCANPAYNYNSDSFSDSASGECITEEPAYNQKSVIYAADFGTEELDTCNIWNSSGQEENVGTWPHNYDWLTATGGSNGSTLVTTGGIFDNGEDFDTTYCTNTESEGNFCAG
jgi:hypothetical protein